MRKNANYHRQRYCPIEHCENFYGVKQGTELQFFCAPHLTTDPTVRERWIRSIRTHQKYDGNAGLIKVCQLHFDPRNIIRKGKYNYLEKGSVPTIFPERKTPIETPPIFIRQETNENRNRPKKCGLLTCKQCIRTAVELSGANANLYNMGLKLKKQESRIETLDQNLERTASQIIPLRIKEPSHTNQNYIPLRTYKRKLVDTPVRTEANESAENGSQHSNDFIRPNGYVGGHEEEKDSEVTPKMEDDGSDGSDDSDDDSDPPNCERQQFAQYIMSTIGDLPESRAEQAMLAIKVFLKRWHSNATDGEK